MNSSLNLISESVKWNIYHQKAELAQKSSHIFAIPVSKHYAFAKKMALEVLSDREQDKSSRLFNQQDKERYVVSKYCLREILSHFLSIAPAEIKFHFEEHHKPATLGIDFNISHTGDFILLAVSQKPIGIDVEYLNRNFDFESILDISFSPNEIEYIGKPVVDTVNFYSLWTRKEALLKAVGEGISDNLHNIECLDEQLAYHDEKFNMKTFLLKEDYIVSVAVQKDIEAINFWYWE